MSTAALPRRATFGAVAALTLAAAAAGVAVAPAANAAAVAGTLSATSGPSGGTNTITMTTAVSKFLSGSTFVQFQVKATATSACSANFGTAATVAATTGVVNVNAPGVTSSGSGGATKILSATKLAITIPNTVALPTGTTTLGLNVCVYNGNTTASTSTTANIVIVNGAYTIASAPAIASISPAGGPALGGGTVTVTGSGFVAGMSGNLSGAALTSVTLVDATHFTAVVPAHSAGVLNLSVTTPGGTKNKTAGGAFVTYTYSNGIVVSPDTTPTATAGTDLDIDGVGFASIDFSTTTGAHIADNNGHVYIVAGAYDPTDNSGVKTVVETGECVNVLVISDTELVCTLDTADADGAGSGTAAIADGTYTITVVNDGGVDVQAGGTGYTGGSVTAGADPNYSQSVISSGATFTVANY
jgi:hypothetical protein